MNWIFPIAGKGKRVKDLGSFKPFIIVRNKKLIEWFFISIKNKFKSNDKLYFITTIEFEKRHQVIKNIKKILKNIKINNKIFFKIIAKTPNGPALTVSNILENLNKKEACTIINSDQLIDFNFPKIINLNRIYIPIHYNSHGKSSYVKISKDNKITAIFEKKLISNYASSGVYIFGSYKILIKSFKSFNKNLNRNEINLSHIINNYLKMNKTFAESLETYLKYDLGSSTNIRNFNNLIKRSF